MILIRTRSSKTENDSFSIYLQELSKTPLLSLEEERELGRRARQGDEAARHRLTKANLRFVVSVAKHYQNQGLSLAELVAAGNEGLIKGVVSFDESRGFKLTTYSIQPIRHSIRQALAEQSRPVQLPSNREAIIYRLQRTEAHLANKLGYWPTAEEVAKEFRLSISEVEEARQLSKYPVPVGVPLDSDGDDNRQFELEDLNSLLPDQKLFQEEMAQKIQQCLDELSPKEAQVIELYFGLNGEEPLTLKAIGQRLGLTRERVRQIKIKALGRLRHPSRVRRLWSCLI